MVTIMLLLMGFGKQCSHVGLGRPLIAAIWYPLLSSCRLPFFLHIFFIRPLSLSQSFIPPMIFCLSAVAEVDFRRPPQTAPCRPHNGMPQDERNNSVNLYGFCKLLVQFWYGITYGFANFSSIQDNDLLRMEVLTSSLKKHIPNYLALPIWVCGAI